MYQVYQHVGSEKADTLQPPVSSGTVYTFGGAGNDILRSPNFADESILIGGAGNDTYSQGLDAWTFVLDGGSDPNDSFVVNVTSTFYEVIVEVDGRHLMITDNFASAGLVLLDWREPENRIEEIIWGDIEWTFDEFSQWVTTQPEYIGSRGLLSIGYPASEVARTDYILADVIERAENVGREMEIGAVARIYLAGLDRIPDPGGLEFWLRRFDNGLSTEGIAQNFINSDEFQERFGSNLTNDEFVNALYQNVLDRDADAGGLDFWTGRLLAGVTRANVLVNFAESQENKLNARGTLDKVVAEVVGQPLSVEEGTTIV